MKEALAKAKEEQERMDREEEEKQKKLEEAKRLREEEVRLLFVFPVGSTLCLCSNFLGSFLLGICLRVFDFPFFLKL